MMAIFTFMTALGISQVWGMLSFVMLNLFLFSFHFSQGSMAWFYVSEVSNDTAAGFASSGQFICLTIISISTEAMINSKMGVTGTIWFYSAWSLFGAIFCYLFVRESRGLTDHQKKNLYTPNNFIEEQKPQGRGIELTSQKMMAPDECTAMMVSQHAQTNCTIPADQT